MKNFKILNIYLIALFILNSCGTVKEGFSLQKKDNTDEFLVEKKNPLKLPPDFDELPVPNMENEIKKDSKKDAIKDLITNKNSTSENVGNINSLKNKNLENFLLEKIKNN